MSVSLSNMCIVNFQFTYRTHHYCARVFSAFFITVNLFHCKYDQLRRELITPKGGGGGGEQGFEVAKTGDARIGFVGVY